MKLKLSEIRSVVREALVEMSMPSHAREIERLYREVMSTIKALGRSLVVEKGPLHHSWIVPGEQFDIPELVNVDLLFYPESSGIPEDDQYGMYNDRTPGTDEFHGGKANEFFTSARAPVGTPRDVPERDRRYTLQFQHQEEAVWSKQKFVKLLPMMLTRAGWYHEMGHLITARKMPSKVHAKYFFDSLKGPAADHAETLGTFVEAFDEKYEMYANSPEKFKNDYPTFQSFVDSIRIYTGAHAGNLGVPHEQAEKWFLKKAHTVYVDLSGG